MIPRTYLGDGVYAEIDSGMVRLDTGNEAGETNQIFLEPEVFRSLIEFYKRVMGSTPEVAQDFEDLEGV
jgi:environmental stress-induced protein Ves